MKIQMTLTGIDESILNIASIHPKINTAIKKEINRTGKEMLKDLKSITPVITGRLRNSAYYEPGEGIDNINATFLDATLGYMAPYASEVEIRHGMLSQTLNYWNEKLYDRVMGASIKALNKLSVKTSYSSENESTESTEPTEPTEA